VAGRIRSNEISDALIGDRTRDLPACSIVIDRYNVIGMLLDSIFSVNRHTEDLVEHRGNLFRKVAY
jgi:hypothetical protein